MRTNISLTWNNRSQRRQLFSEEFALKEEINFHSASGEAIVSFRVAPCETGFKPQGNLLLSSIVAFP